MMYEDGDDEISELNQHVTLQLMLNNLLAAIEAENWGEVKKLGRFAQKKALFIFSHRLEECASNSAEFSDGNRSRLSELMKKVEELSRGKAP